MPLLRYTSAPAHDINMKNLWLLAIGLCLALAFWLAIGSIRSSAEGSAVPAAATSLEARSSFARRLENQLEQQGISAHVTLEGEDGRQLRIEWHSITRHDIYDLLTSPAIRREARPLGLKTIVFADGGGSRQCGRLSQAECEERWEWDFDGESMIWHPSPL